MRGTKTASCQASCLGFGASKRSVRPAGAPAPPWGGFDRLATFKPTCSEPQPKFESGDEVDLDRRAVGWSLKCDDKSICRQI
jgi:hypothetical protein